MTTIESFFQPLSAAFFWLLQFLHIHLGTSWSWSIVILTLVVRLVLIPLTWHQIKSMRALQALQPQIQTLQEKYKDDRELLGQKTMEFYHENKVSPFGSCLPLLLQMPVFMGLYYMLREQGQAGGAFFDPNPAVSWLWIADITKFDLVLMFLYVASQFLASWQTARKAAPPQKIIASVMPLGVGIFMYLGKWPAGLFIYWCTSNIWTIVQQFMLERVVPPPPSPDAAEMVAARPPNPAKETSSAKPRTSKRRDHKTVRKGRSGPTRAPSKKNRPKVVSPASNPAGPVA
jgi:YidC/Oxa1 family membrane protein insertase